MERPIAAVYRTELTPLSFLERSAIVWPHKTAIVHDDVDITYLEMAGHTTRLAHAFSASGIKAGDRVAYLCPNTPEMPIAHFGVPLIGAVLVAINTRLSPQEIQTILNHSGARMLVGDAALLGGLASIINQLETVTEVVSVDGTDTDPGFETTPYNELLSRGSDDPLPWSVDDEERTISINYTSGTTGQPKGVMYTHRGAYLNALGEIIHSRHSLDSEIGRASCRERV